MIRAILGVGPRVGTSWTMSKLVEAGLPVHYNADFSDLFPEEGNPMGYFETPVEEHLAITNKIVKVWPLAPHPSIERMVILERDYDDQLASVEKQMVREEEFLKKLKIDWTPQEFIMKSRAALSPLLSTPHLRVRTEDLNERINEITNYLRY